MIKAKEIAQSGLMKITQINRIIFLFLISGLEETINDQFLYYFLNTILKAENLTKKFSSVLAVDNLNFSLDQGKITALLGRMEQERRRRSPCC